MYYNIKRNTNGNCPYYPYYSTWWRFLEMKSVIETLLIKKYGMPEIVNAPNYIEYWWNRDDESKSSVLYVDYNIDESELIRNRKCQNIYGKYCGGFIIGDSLKIATLSGIKIYGLYSLGELQGQLELCKIYDRYPKITFFMDAANVWFYGFQDNSLFVYDLDTDELDEIDELESGLEAVIDEWIHAADKR